MAATADHDWDFRGCVDGEAVVDERAGSELQATLMNGAHCTAEGVSFDGVNDYVDLDDWEWGGALTIEAYVKYEKFNMWSMVLDFSSGINSDNVILCNKEETSTISWFVRQGSNEKNLRIGSWDQSVWTHVVVTASGTTMKVFENGALVGSIESGHEPLFLTRTQHWLGRSAWATDGYFEGSIAFVRVWHGVGLGEGEVGRLKPCPVGRYAPSGFPEDGACTACAAGEETNGQGATSEAECVACPAGRYGATGGETCSACGAGWFSEAIGSVSADDCEECEAGKTSGSGSDACVVGCLWSVFVNMANTSYLGLAEVAAFDSEGGLIGATGVEMYSWGWGGVPENCIDGDLTNYCHVGGNEGAEWLRVDYATDVGVLSTVRVTNRVDCCQERIAGAKVYVGMGRPGSNEEGREAALWTGEVGEGGEGEYTFEVGGVSCPSN
jgi:hypothetical protein